MVDPDGRQTFSTQTVENCGGTCFPKEETPQTQTYLNHNAYDPHLFLFYQYGDWSYQGDGGGINMSEWNQPTGAQVIEAVHLALDVAGIVPVVGDGADVINAAIYLAEGDISNAGISVAAAVPFVGAAATAGKWASRAGSAITGVGKYADDSIAARSAARKFSGAERAQIDSIGRTTGCHTCGTTDPGTLTGHFVPDHQPPSALNLLGGAQRLYPQCVGCSRAQGLEIARQKRGSR
jgi:hypothetical protein